MNDLIEVRNTLTSLEVAEMMEIRHTDLIRKLEGDKTHIGIVQVLSNQPQLALVEYYQESTYIDTKGETRKCYNITRKGCEMLAHKMTGEKGILFTAKYIERFHAMENYIREKEVPKLPTTYKQALIELLAQVEENEKLNEKLEHQQPLVELAETRIDKKGCFSITDATKTLGLKRGNITRWAKEEGYLHKTQTEVNKLGEKYFKVYSSDGKHNQIGVTEEGLRIIKENINQVRLS